MMEIEKRIEKFRAWNKELKTMDYDGGFLYDLSDFDINNYKYLCLNIFINKLSEELTLMRFIGSHDTIGKEIYEGDMVKWKEQVGKDESVKSNDDIFGLVMWDKEECRFIIVQLTKGIWKYQIGESLFEHDTQFYSHDGAEFSWGELEIVGNIYENPDLYKDLREGTQKC